MGTFHDELHEERRERERQSNERIRKAREPVQSEIKKVPPVIHIQELHLVPESCRDFAEQYLERGYQVYLVENEQDCEQLRRSYGDDWFRLEVTTISIDFKPMLMVYESPPPSNPVL